MSLSTLPPSSWVHVWLSPLFNFLKFVVAYMTGASQYTFVDAVATLPLAANTYANGTAGVGATLTGNANGALAAVDGVTPTAGMVLLLANEAASANNGAYVVTTVGNASTAYVLTRLAGFDASASMLVNTQFFVKSGTLHGGHVWSFGGSALPTVGTTALLFSGSVKPSLFRGSIPSSRLVFSVNPTNNDTVAVGGTTITFLTTLTTAGASAQVKIGSSAAATLARTWSVINLNQTGKKDSDQSAGTAVVTVTAAMISLGTVYIEFPFVPTSFMSQAFSSAGVQRNYSDATAISGNALVVTLGGGASPNIQANDVLTVRAFQ